MIGSLLVALIFSLYSWWFLTSSTYSTNYFAYSSLLPAPVLIVYLVLGLLYVTSTTRGLSWWDATVILFRFHGFHQRRSYLENEIIQLIDENEDGYNYPFRAFLTLERLFMHEFNAGQVTRKILEEINPGLFNEFQERFDETKSIRRISHLPLLVAAVIGFLSILLLMYGISFQIPFIQYISIVDIDSTISFTFFLIWMIHATLEIPLLRIRRNEEIEQHDMTLNGTQIQ
jgi:hypothetical protein